jgi:molybdate transport system substrate-binding protein
VRTSSRHLAGPLAGLLAAGLLTACGSGGPATSADPAGRRTLTVFAAASLRGTFTEIGRGFEAANPGVTVTFSFAGSADLATQIAEGAPADVFASADERNMAQVTGASLTAADPVDFATNVLEIATPPGNPAGITGLADLARPGVDVVVCAPQVPCGAATDTVEARSGVTLSPVSEESSVTDVLGKVTSGEADAGLVYVTDVAAAGDRVTGVAFPESADAVNTYPIAALAGAADPGLAERFVAFVTAPAAQAALRDAGFGAA